MMNFEVLSKTEIQKVKGKDEYKYKYLLKKNDNNYYALKWNSLENPIIYDYEYDTVLSESNWYIMSIGYANNHEEYMHRLIAKLANFAVNDYTIDHINEYKLDNRVKNLRIATQSQQNENRVSRCDKVDPCEELKKIGVDEFPRYVRWDRTEKKFVIDKHPWLITEVKQGLRKKATMSGSKSSKISIIEKYQDILSRIKELDQLNLNDTDQEFQKLKEENTKEYEDICKCIKQYEGTYVYPEEKEIPVIDPVKRTVAGRKTVSKLPDNCGVKPEDIPKYCWYKAATDKRGDKFVIDRHPKMKERQWSTTESTKKTTLEKFNMLMEKYNELNKTI